MTDVLLTSEDFVKSMTNISDNVAAGYLLPSIREAQDMYLQPVLGTRLFDCLKDKVAAGPVSGIYLQVLNKAQYFLAYQAIALLLPKVSVKIANMGAVRTNDDNVQNVTTEEAIGLAEQYQKKADFYCRRLQEFVCANSAQIPELSKQQADQMAANLYSAASCGVWLGGARGKIVGPRVSVAKNIK